MGETRQLAEWRGEFGDAYIDRNQPSAEGDAQLVRAWGSVLLRCLPQPRSVLEVGANVGRNLRALRSVTAADLFAVEPNPTARGVLAESGILPADHVRDGHTGSLPFDDCSVDLVFTAGVLIHVPEEAIDAGLAEMHRVSGRYLLSMEYFAPSTQTVRYRGRDDMDLLFKRDYGGLWLDAFPDLRLVDYGFLWRRVTGLDDLTWWLFQKN